MILAMIVASDIGLLARVVWAQNFHVEFYMSVYLCILLPVNDYFPVDSLGCGCRPSNLY